ncbi:phenylacetate--CoA ligase family protein [Pectinatus frisingensis]|uniref:phenylacetate--CoA ligase family protein n=1 Tax=Pectinatus frisingensis TaxID=865 RepID=UPI003D803553
MAEKLEHRNISASYKALYKNETLSQNEIKQLQLKKLKKMLIYAYNNISYYHNLFDSIGFIPEMVQKLSDIETIPYLTKDIIKENEKLFVNEASGNIPRKTGGSTGGKLTVYYNQKSLDITAAIHRRCMRWCGKFLGEKEIHFSSNTTDEKIISPRDKYKEQMKCIVMNRKNILLDIFDTESVQDILTKIKLIKPVLIQGFPSIAYNLADFAEENSIDMFGTFKFYESTGETLYDFQREKIENIFGCEVYNRYGNAEFGVIAHECKEHNGLHIMEDIIYLETIPSQTLKSENEIIVTTLTNYAMPLIRYKTGDLGSICDGKCSCGLPFRKIINMSGRIHDFLQLDDGRIISTSLILDILDKYNGVNNFQVRLKDGTLELFIVPGEKFTLDKVKEIQKDLYRVISHNIDLYLIDKLYLTPMGKYRYIISDNIKVKKISCLDSNKYGNIYNHSNKKIFIKINNMICVEGFNDLEYVPEGIFIWCKARTILYFEVSDPCVEILSSTNSQQTLYIYTNQNVARQKIPLLHGWNKYTLHVVKNEFITIKVDPPIPDAEKNGDKRELGVGFREILNK